MCSTGSVRAESPRMSSKAASKSSSTPSVDAKVLVVVVVRGRRREVALRDDVICRVVVVNAQTTKRAAGRLAIEERSAYDITKKEVLPKNIAK
jgi:hypothetical protein